MAGMSSMWYWFHKIVKSFILPLENCPKTKSKCMFSGSTGRQLTIKNGKLSTMTLYPIGASTSLNHCARMGTVCFCLYVSHSEYLPSLCSPPSYPVTSHASLALSHSMLVRHFSYIIHIKKT